ncbi:hypothetical protein H0H93_009877 [Arthromyces matolae]|nr:hypothetical protein H0H93_009877 [Arthromyces matolae]
MTRSSRPTRGDQPYTGGLGKAFKSPIKRSNAKRPNPVVNPLGHDIKRQRLQMELEALQAHAVQGNEHDTVDLTLPSAPADPPNLIPDSSVEVKDEQPFKEFPEATVSNSPSRRSPQKNPRSLYYRWNSLLPDLIEPYLSYITATVGAVPEVPIQIAFPCQRKCTPVLSTIIGLFQTRKSQILALNISKIPPDFSKLTVQSCNCRSLAQVLVSNGLFPTAPSQPRMAISILLLDFYHTLFERSCDAVNALASALTSFYLSRGFVPCNQKNKPMRDPFRKGLGYAIQWYDNLQVLVEEQVEAAIVSADQDLQDSKSLPSQSEPVQPKNAHCLRPDAEKPSSQPETSGLKEECARILQRRCPACFGGTVFGRSFDEGGDIHVAIDGNFNHRHLISSGDCPKFYNPEYFLSKEQVDEAGQRIEVVRGRKPNKRTAIVPDEAIDECESSHVAGSGSNTKTNMDKFDDGGVMALVCRHDIPLFLANIDTPGEQQKYGVALLTHFFTLLPATATVAALYDVGCVLDRSSQLYDIFSDSIRQRLLFATSAMHAYAHQWACQLIYNPRLRVGLGLTDGEGVERLWSRLRKLIGITRTSHRARRIWMLDRQVRLIGLEHKEDLGLWINRRLTKGVEAQGKSAQKILSDCGIPESTLRTQWDLQRASQLSIRAHAPARLKKELDTILGLQGELESIDTAIQNVKAEFSRARSIPKEAKESLTSLEKLQADVKEQSETLYTSLNVHESFPELRHVDLEFVRLLFMARDLKINIRKRAIGSFFEWDKLDQAVGGREQSLGTKLHQATRKAISKRKPALMNAIRKFNGYCAKLASLYKAEWNIPVPEPLPLELTSLRESPLLQEDVWIAKSEGDIPLWLKDVQVRQGIRALLKIDRCLEERRRLGIEADNMCRWFGRELCAVQVALSRPSNQSIALILKQKCSQLLVLKDSWSNTMASKLRFDSHVRTAASLAIDHATTTSNASPLTWLTPTTSKSERKQVCLIEDSQDLDSFEAATDDENPLETSVDDDDTPELIDLFEETEHDSTNSRLLFLWTLPAPLHIHTQLLQQLNFQTSTDFVPPNLRRYLSFKGTRILFDASDVAIMKSPTRMLNDTCINGLASLLQYQLSDPSHINSRIAAQGAIFSTFDLPLLQTPVADIDLWRRVHKTEYWAKRYWILPIHRPAPALHWVVCCILLESRRILLFDSLATKEAWVSELPDIQHFIERLVVLANRQEHPLHVVTDEGWEVNPTLVQPCQTNGYDCGIWVLATIGAFLNGSHRTDLREQDMPVLRSLLLHFVHASGQLTQKNLKAALPNLFRDDMETIDQDTWLALEWCDLNPDSEYDHPSDAPRCRSPFPDSVASYYANYSFYNPASPPDWDDILNFESHILGQNIDLVEYGDDHEFVMSYDEWIACLALGKDVNPDNMGQGCGEFVDCGIHYPGDEEAFIEMSLESTTYEEDLQAWTVFMATANATLNVSDPTCRSILCRITNTTPLRFTEDPALVLYVTLYLLSTCLWRDISSLLSV